MEILFGVRTHMSGDKFNPFEGSLVVMNHRTRLDWNFLWAGMFHFCQPHSHNLKFVLKAPLMHLPGPGRWKSCFPDMTVLNSGSKRFDFDLKNKQVG